MKRSELMPGTNQFFFYKSLTIGSIHTGRSRNNLGISFTAKRYETRNAE